jgi:xanthine/CO dehydrogenase XdhC/CoxF family maturation factor
MKELAAILRAQARQPDQTAALATLAQASGSTYRRPGARLWISSGGESVGSISGGCLEQDVIEKAQGVMQSGQTLLLDYDTTSEEDLVFGAGMGCKGVVHILVELVRPGSSAAGLIQFANRLFQRRRSGVAATVFRLQGSVQARLGDRLLLDPDGQASGIIQDPALQSKMLAAAREILPASRPRTVEFDLAAGAAGVFVEVIQPPAPLVIFGAGYDAAPLARLAKEVGFHVTVADARPAYAQAGRFPEADAVVVARPEEISQLALNDQTAAVIMSHNYLTDRAFLKALLPLPLRYLGLMGPKDRARKMLQELRREGFAAGEAMPPQIHNPVGLDIGAEDPEQIALAILAEIQAVLSGHAGGMLRDKKSAIHSPASAL